MHRWRTGAGLPVLDAVDAGITGPLRQRIDGSLARQGEMLRHLTRWFGPYPFETIGGVIDDLDIGFALENQTRPVYSPVFWDLPQFPTLGDDVVVHEIAHQWYGDSVGVDRWQDIWLNEGFATYAEWLWQRAEHGFTPAEIFRANYQAIPARDDFWSVRIGDPGTDALFSGPVYLRGAMTLQALRATIGREDFFRVLRAWGGSIATATAALRTSSACRSGSPVRSCRRCSALGSSPAGSRPSRDPAPLTGPRPGRWRTHVCSRSSTAGGAASRLAWSSGPGSAASWRTCW